MAWKRLILMKKFILATLLIFFYNNSSFANNHDSYKKLTMVKAKTIVLMAKQPLINAKKLKPRDEQTELFAKNTYCKSIVNLMKDWPNPLPSEVKKEVLQAYDYLKTELEKENC